MVEGFESWYQRLHPQLVVALIGSFGDREIAGDAADEACVRALERWDSVSRMEFPEGWAFRVAYNVAKRRARRRSMESILLRGRCPVTADGPAGEIWLLVSDLPARQRHAVVLRHVGDFTEAEIGEVMGIGRGTVSATLRAAYRSLRSALAADLLEGTTR